MVFTRDGKKACLMRRTSTGRASGDEHTVTCSDIRFKSHVNYLKRSWIHSDQVKLETDARPLSQFDLSPFSSHQPSNPLGICFPHPRAQNIQSCLQRHHCQPHTFNHTTSSFPPFVQISETHQVQSTAASPSPTASRSTASSSASNPTPLYVSSP